MDASDVADKLHARLAALGDPERAENQKRYLKSDLAFLGLTVPEIRKVVKTWWRSVPGLGHDELVAAVETLWAEPVHERRMAAVEMLGLGADLLSPQDVPLLERLVRESRTWALVDNLAATILGGVDERFPEAMDPVVRRWATDGDFWVRRTALLVHLGPLRRGDGNFERFGELADAMLDETEFFVRKAIGWILRDTARKRPELVAGWLEPRAHRAAGLTVREAVKHLPDDLRERVLAARDA